MQEDRKTSSHTASWSSLIQGGRDVSKRTHDGGNTSRLFLEPNNLSCLKIGADLDEMGVCRKLLDQGVEKEHSLYQQLANTSWEPFILQACLIDVIDPPDFLGSKALRIDYLSAERGWVELGKGRLEALKETCSASSIEAPWHELFSDAETHGLQVHELTAFINRIHGSGQLKFVDLTLGMKIKWPCFEGCGACEDERNK